VELPDHNWDRPDYPEMVLGDAKASRFVDGTAWHHYGGEPSAMTKVHEEFPHKDEWITEAGGGAWQKGYRGNGNVLAEEAAELIAATRNWSRAYIMWTLATDQNHGPHLGGCDVCRGLVTIDTSDPNHPVKRELDYYVLGHASKFLYPGAVRIASDGPAGTDIKDVAFLNVDGTVVLYALNAGADSLQLAVRIHEKQMYTVIPGGALATLVWK
jgi:glucosylceramidase